MKNVVLAVMTCLIGVSALAQTNKDASRPIAALADRNAARPIAALDTVWIEEMT
jgi:hypothetical protein